MSENAVATLIAAAWFLLCAGPFIGYATYMQWRERHTRDENTSEDGRAT